MEVWEVWVLYFRKTERDTIRVELFYDREDAMSFWEEYKHLGGVLKSQSVN